MQEPLCGLFCSTNSSSSGEWKSVGASLPTDQRNHPADAGAFVCAFFVQLTAAPAANLVDLFVHQRKRSSRFHRKNTIFVRALLLNKPGKGHSLLFPTSGRKLFS
ncbi:hypothetical protein DPMN_100263 [Dreissena polymorpha]|uniref:Uncharacterized protein n=1 Tax=Dreissena polymorpha TaxID=45954 RepID=A0A9D4LHW5_DREPO|nr:hypothetical protein DPMN_100263 [Dreissena polymorpha]